MREKHGGYKNRGDDEKEKKCGKVISCLSEHVQILGVCLALAIACKPQVYPCHPR